MDVVKNSSTLRNCTSKYNVHSRIIKNLLDEYESHHDSSAGIYVTASVETQCILIAQNRNMKEVEKIKNTKVNALKRAARINQRATSFAKLVANLPNDMMASEDNSTPSSKSSSLSQLTSSRTPISILAERWVSCLI